MLLVARHLLLRQLERGLPVARHLIETTLLATGHLLLCHLESGLLATGHLLLGGRERDLLVLAEALRWLVLHIGRFLCHLPRGGRGLADGTLDLGSKVRHGVGVEEEPGLLPKWCVEAEP